MPLVCNVASSMAPQLQFIDKVGYMCLRLVPMVQTVQLSGWA